jgi:phosphoadenosine phosphosulfate reductase
MIDTRSIMTTAAMFEPQLLGATAAFLERELLHAQPADILATAQRTFGRGRVAVVASFGTEAAALLKIVADADRAMPVLLVGSGWRSEAAVAYLDALIARLGLADVRTIAPSPAARDRALAAFDGSINGCTPHHDGEPSRVVRTDGLRLEFNAFARLSRQDIDAIVDAARLPRAPLEADGFASAQRDPCVGWPRPEQHSSHLPWRGSRPVVAVSEDRLAS